MVFIASVTFGNCPSALRASIRKCKNALEIKYLPKIENQHYYREKRFVLVIKSPHFSISEQIKND